MEKLEAKHKELTNPLNFIVKFINDAFYFANTENVWQMYMIVLTFFN